MCGIVGIISNSEINSDLLLSNIHHRGPDSCGYFKFGRLNFGHTRLSIQDLSLNGAQPMHSIDGRFVIIFNGEIYNHLEIRQKHLSEFVFKSTSDTETILNAFIKFGKGMLDLLNGIFAFAIFDKKTKNLFIARDHYGVKPLYYFQSESTFMFGSELKSFIKLNNNWKINPKGLFNYLTYLWSPGKHTAMEGVYKLLPGHCIILNTSQNLEIRIESFKKQSFSVDHNKTEEMYIEELDQLLQNAVQRQLLSDVPVGFFLSGGLDSSLIVAIARKINPKTKINCFTIDTGEGDKTGDGFVNDLFYAKAVAELFQADLKIVKSDINILKEFEKMIWHLDEPQSDAAPLSVLKISELAHKNGIKVLLGGTGGDDLFSGYRRHRAIVLEKYIRYLPKVLKLLIKKITNLLPSKIPMLRRIKKLFTNINLETNDRLIGYFNWLEPDRVTKLFSSDYQELLIGYDSKEYFHTLDSIVPNYMDLLDRMLYYELNTFLVDHNLNYTDKMGMAEGVEIRVPFLDLDLVSFSQKLPSDMKMKNGETKYILKKVAERYLPREIVYRSKTGFGAPVRSWITNDLMPILEQRFTEKEITNKGIFNHSEIWKLIRENNSGKIDASYSILALLAIDSWVDQFIINQ